MNRGCRDCGNCWNCWNCWNCRDCGNCRNCDECEDCRDCRNCEDCRGCGNVVNGFMCYGLKLEKQDKTKYWMFNKEISKKEWDKRFEIEVRA